MIQRCENPKVNVYRLYGGMGVRVHGAWRASFAAFLNDVGRRPSATHSLDRYPDPNGNYEPSNVRWATDVEQGRNRRNNRRLTVDGHTMCLTEAAIYSGVHRETIARRLNEGESDEDALRPIPLPPVLLYLGIPMTLAELSKFVDIPYSSLERRIKQHGSANAAVELWRRKRARRLERVS